MTKVKHIIFTLISITLINISFGAYILIPMDETQKNHLKAYGIAYWALQEGAEVDWLLNYRGGSFALKQMKPVQDECNIRGVSFELIADAQYTSILSTIASPEKNMDIAKFLLDQCSHDAEIQRVGKELLLFQEREMFDLLKYLKYLVDTMRANNIVWGVGRGSSVSSFVLYLIGVHRINSLYYGLEVEEFIR